MKNNFVRSAVFAALLLFAGAANAQKSQTVTFQTSAQCGMCKDRIEEVMNYVPGVQYAELNLEDFSLTIKYKTKKTNPDELRIRVSKIGYSADDVEADEEAMLKLPLCCQPGAHR